MEENALDAIREALMNTAIRCDICGKTHEKMYVCLSTEKDEKGREWYNCNKTFCDDCAGANIPPVGRMMGLCKPCKERNLAFEVQTAQPPLMVWDSIRAAYSKWGKP